MESTIQKNYQLLLAHYGNKYTDFDLFFQNYEGLFVFSRIDIVYNILTKLLKDGYITTDQKILETGSGDGRIVALIAILGFKAFGIEFSNDMKEKSLEHINQLNEIQIFKEKPLIVQGDFLNSESYNKLNCSFQDIDVFFNYYTNTEMLVSKIYKEGKQGTLLISVSLSKKPVKTDLELLISSTLPDRNHYLFVYKKV